MGVAPDRTKSEQVDRIIDELAQGGRDVGEGVFTLDAKAARRKLRDFQVADPHWYVLMLVQSAVLKGATKIDFTLRARSLTLQFNGRPFTRQELLDAFAEPFVNSHNDDARARQQLGLALVTAFALNPRLIRVCSGPPDQRVCLVCDGPDSQRVEDGDPSQDARGTRIDVHLPGRLSQPLRGARNFLRITPEERLIRQRCGYATQQIRIHEETISEGPSLPVASLTVPLEGYSGEAGQARSSEQTFGSALLIQHGVWISTVPMAEIVDDTVSESDLNQLVAVVDVGPLQRDVSQVAFVRDDAYDAVIQSLGNAVQQSLALKPSGTYFSPEDVSPIQYPNANGEVKREESSAGLSALLGPLALPMALVGVIVTGSDHPSVALATVAAFAPFCTVMCITLLTISILLVRRGRSRQQGDAWAIGSLLIVMVGIAYLIGMVLVTGVQWLPYL